MDDSKKRFLVVEDEKSISDIIRYNLEKRGFSVYAAYDGEEALTKQAVLDPDLLLLDVMLPEKNGWIYRLQSAGKKARFPSLF